MKRLLLAFALLTLGSALVHADEQIRAVQQALHDAGFYLGEINGEPSNDLNAAIKRFQLRNGMQGTGQLNDEVLQALNIGGAPAPAPAPGPQPNSNAPIPGFEPGPGPSPQPNPERGGFQPGGVRPQGRQPYDLRRGDQPQPEAQPRGGFQPPGGPDTRFNPQPAGGAPNPVYSEIFWGTPFAVAPEEVQRSTVVQCQKLLKSHNVYRGNIDGQPGPKMTDALRWFQQNSAHIPVTGRLDMPTLSALHLLPGGPAGPRTQPYNYQGGPPPGAPRGAGGRAGGF